MKMRRMRCKKVIVKHEGYELNENDPYFVKWLISVLNNNNSSFSDLARILHITRSTVYCWTNDKAKPRYTDIYVICKEYNVEEDPETIYKNAEDDYKCRRSKK